MHGCDGTCSRGAWVVAVLSRYEWLPENSVSNANVGPVVGVHEARVLSTVTGVRAPHTSHVHHLFSPRILSLSIHVALSSHLFCVHHSRAQCPTDGTRVINPPRRTEPVRAGDTSRYDATPRGHPLRRFTASPTPLDMFASRAAVLLSRYHAVRPASARCEADRGPCCRHRSIVARDNCVPSA